MCRPDGRHVFLKGKVQMITYLHIIDINYYNGYILRIDCGKAEDGLITTPNSQRMLDALAIDNPLEYARLYLDSEMQDWVNAMNMEWYST